MNTSILVMGGAHVDRRGRTDGAAVMGASNPGRFIEEPGGGGFNAARALARLGHPVRLLSPRGGDAAGDSVTQAAIEAGIDDRPFVFLDRATPSYTAILDSKGDLVIALADMELYRLFSPRRLATLSARAAVDGVGALLCDANLPEPTLSAIADLARARAIPVAAIAISPAKVIRFRSLLSKLDWLFMNAAEAAALTGVEQAEPEQWPGLLRDMGLAGGVITHGPGPMIAFQGDTTIRLQPPRLDKVADVTGAGDATAASFFSAILSDMPIADAARLAVAAALVTLGSPNAAASSLSRDLLDLHLPLVPTAEMLS